MAELRLPMFEDGKWVVSGVNATSLARHTGIKVDFCDQVTYWMQEASNFGAGVADGDSAGGAMVTNKTIGIRPMMRIPATPQFVGHGTSACLWGNFPQTAVKAELNDTLVNGILQQQIPLVQTPLVLNSDISHSLEENAVQYYTPPVCFYEGKKYLGVRTGGKQDFQFFKYEPVMWKANFDTGYMITTKAILSGLQFDDKEYDGDFESTRMSATLKQIGEEMERPTVGEPVQNNQAATPVPTNWNDLKPLIQLCALDMLSKAMTNCQARIGRNDTLDQVRKQMVWEMVERLPRH